MNKIHFKILLIIPLYKIKNKKINQQKKILNYI